VAVSPDTIREQGKTIRMPPKPLLSGFALEFSEINQRFPLKLGAVTLGAAPGNDIVIDIATVSGRHAEFVVTPTECQVKDLNSTNGTLVNGNPIGSHTVLKIGDIIKFGSAKGMIIRNVNQ
jgi:pSer/pThr/pTyr-binding forkhead associated (FHA) protein